MDPRNLIIGKFTNSSKDWTHGEQDIQYIDLKRTSGYQNGFKFDYKDDELFQGLNTYQVLLYSNETYWLHLYNGWNFIESSLWDEFWFEPETQMLFQTKNYNLSD